MYQLHLLRIVSTVFACAYGCCSFHFRLRLTTELPNLSHITIQLCHTDPTPNPTEQPTPLPTPLPTFAAAAAFTAAPTTASPTPKPNMDNGQLAMNIITGEECVIPGSNTCSVESNLSACDGNKPYCCNKDNGNGSGDLDKCTTKGGVRSCKAGIASPNTCSQMKPSSNAKNNEVGVECEGGLFCCVQEQGNKKWGSCMTQAECEAATGSRRGLFSSFGGLRNLAQDDDEDDNTCKKKKVSYELLRDVVITSVHIMCSYLTNASLNTS